MSAYAIAQLRDVRMGPEVEDYLRRIDATLERHGGRFLVHGAPLDRREGAWPEGDLVIVEFPSLDAARAWYDSPDYRAIAPLRTRNASGDLVLVEGVAHPHRATDILAPSAP